MHNSFACSDPTTIYRIVFYNIITIVVISILVGILKFKNLGITYTHTSSVTSFVSSLKTSIKQEVYNTSLSISTSLVNSSSSTAISSSSRGEASPIGLVKITVIVDNNPEGFGLETARGLSVLVEITKPYHRVILFNTKPSPTTLVRNLKKLEIDPKDINYTVIPHERGDQVNGLEYLAKIKPGFTVYEPSHISRYTIEWARDLGFRVVRISNTTWTDKGVAIIGESYDPPMNKH